MKMWKISLAVLLFLNYQLECALIKTPSTAKPVTMQLPPATPQALSNIQQEIIALKQQLTDLETKNTELKKLKALKKELKQRSNVMYTLQQKQLQQNNPFLLELKATINKKKIDPELKKKTEKARQLIAIDHSKLNDLHKNIQGLKTKINRIAPQRAALLKKLHDAKNLLKETQLAAEAAKIQDRPA